MSFLPTADPWEIDFVATNMTANWVISKLF